MVITILLPNCLQVPLGILPKNEMKHDEMIEILDTIQKYVPTQSTVKKVNIPGTSENLEVTVDQFHHTLFGGNMLTAARARQSKDIRINSQRGKDRLE